jgi:tRNA-specific 2-thiouridylase
MCNEKLKFGNLWSKAAALGCDYIATGHYAIIEHLAHRAVLRKGVDPRKDQSYFLFSLRQAQLRRALTPLGKMLKPQIREIAHSLRLKVADKVDSQEICFVPGNNYKAFLRSHLGEREFHRGEIYDVDGNFIAQHDGIELFTIGQRKGLPGGSARPRYVVDLDPETNRVIVGDADDLIVDEFEVDRVNRIDSDAANEISDVIVKIRYSHPGAAATLTPLENGRAHIRLHEPQRAVTPGQAAVFYDGDLVLGGGWICRTEPVGRREALGRVAAPVPA